MTIPVVDVQARCGFAVAKGANASVALGIWRSRLSVLLSIRTLTRVCQRAGAALKHPARPAEERKWVRVLV